MININEKNNKKIVKKKRKKKKLLLLFKIVNYILIPIWIVEMNFIDNIIQINCTIN